MIRIEGVSKFFDDKPAVRNISLEVPKGSLFGLIGPNGAGKTTTLKMLATLIKPDSGEIFMDGLDVLRDVRAVRRIVGYMSDSFGSFRGLTCEEYLQFFGRAYGLHGRTLERRLEDVLALTELGALRDELTGALSAGMGQRLSLAKTFLHDPEVLILDEPASGLDPRARIELRCLLTELGKMGKTIIISSHILADLEEICTDVAIIELGEVVWHGSLKEAVESRDGERLVTQIQVRKEDVERTVTLLEKLEFVRGISSDSGRIRAEVDRECANRLLAALLGENIEVLSFSRDRLSLEALFLERTRGIVS